LPTLFDIVAASVPLKRRGKAWWAPCPFHAPDKTGSFKIEQYRGKWRFHCFGCHAGGDAVDWIQRTRKVDFKEAKRLLGEEAARPDPELKRQRQAAERRQRILRAYRDRNPDCVAPDWLIQ